MCDLKGPAHVINLSEISRMMDKERWLEEGLLHDLRQLLTDSKQLPIVDNVPDLVKMAEHIFLKLDAEQLTGLHLWHPKMPQDLWGCLRYEFPGRWEQLTRAFRGTTHPGWRWDLHQEPSCWV